MKDSGTAGIQTSDSKSQEQKPDSSSDESESSYNESSDKEVVVKVPRKRRSASQTTFQHVYHRRTTEVVAKNDRFLEIHEVAFHPSLAKHR